MAEGDTLASGWMQAVACTPATFHGFVSVPSKVEDPPDAFGSEERQAYVFSFQPWILVSSRIRTREILRNGFLEGRNASRVDLEDRAKRPVLGVVNMVLRSDGLRRRLLFSLFPLSLSLSLEASHTHTRIPFPILFCLVRIILHTIRYDVRDVPPYDPTIDQEKKKKETMGRGAGCIPSILFFFLVCFLGSHGFFSLSFFHHPTT